MRQLPGFCRVGQIRGAIADPRANDAVVLRYDAVELRYIAMRIPRVLRGACTPYEDTRKNLHALALL